MKSPQNALNKPKCLPAGPTSSYMFCLNIMNSECRKSQRLRRLGGCHALRGGKGCHAITQFIQKFQKIQNFQNDNHISYKL